MDNRKKEGRYQRIYKQIQDLMIKSEDASARMCTISAILHHKMPNFFWTGFYLLHPEGKLIVRSYQGPVACMELEKNKGVCWAAINSKQTQIVPNVEAFPDHIACDARSKSEIVIPITNQTNDIIGVLDIDSDQLNCFDETDGKHLEKIVALIYS